MEQPGPKRMDEENISSFAQSSGTAQRTHKPSPLPKAPQGAEVAQRLLKHASIRPVQRFDSADYFLQLHEQRQKTPPEGAERSHAEQRVSDALSGYAAFKAGPGPRPVHVHICAWSTKKQSKINGNR